MKIIALVSTLLVASASAFAPAASSERSVTTALNMDRRSAMGAVAAAGVVVAMPSVASADGAISTATRQRSKFLYGSRITALQEAVDKGDFSAVASEKNAFILYNSGAYPAKKEKAQKNDAVAATNTIFAAIRTKDKAALKTSFKSYLSVTKMSDYQAELDGSQGQGYSTDSDYRKLTKQGAIYVR